MWDTKTCIQCGKCAMVCPHSVIRIKVYDSRELDGAPPTFKSTDARDKEWQGLKYTIQVAPEDCTGCAICVDICPAKNKSETRLKAINMEDAASAARAGERELEILPEASGTRPQEDQADHHPPAAGAGTAVRILRRLLGMRRNALSEAGFAALWRPRDHRQCDRLLFHLRRQSADHSLEQECGRPRAGLVELAVRRQCRIRSGLPGLDRQADRIRPRTDYAPVAPRSAKNCRQRSLLTAPQKDEADIFEQRERVALLKERLQKLDSPEAKQLLALADMLVKKSVWIVGGDGWAYDIGYGGLDHVLASGLNVNLLVLDTEVYSNTGGQASKSTPRAAVAKFAAGGKPRRKKDLGLMAMSYGNVYVASVAMGAKDEHTLKAFLEAEAYDGPSLIIAYSHCIAHGINMTTAMSDQKIAVDSGHWLLYRYNPERTLTGENPLTLDSRTPTKKVKEFLQQQTRFQMLTKSKPEDAKRLWAAGAAGCRDSLSLYEYLAQRGKEQPAKDRAVRHAQRRDRRSTS